MSQKGEAPKKRNEFITRTLSGAVLLAVVLGCLMFGKATFLLLLLIIGLGSQVEFLGISRQGVHDNLSRAEALLRNMEAKTGCAGRDQLCRKAAGTILESARQLLQSEDPAVSALAQHIMEAAKGLEE